VVNHDNICIVNVSSLFKNIDGGVPMESDSLAGMPSLENLVPIVNSLYGLQQLDSTQSSSKEIPNSLTCKEPHFVVEVKINS